jgi:hypothetical protein
VSVRAVLHIVDVLLLAMVFHTFESASASAQTPPPVASGQIVSGSIPLTGGHGLIVFSGGTYDQLVTASRCPTVRVALWATQGGSFIVFVPSTTVGAVNAPFESAFPNRTIPAHTAFLGRCEPLVAADPRSATYELEGRLVTLIDGLAEVEAAPGSASKVTTRYFGNEASGDLDGDGLADTGAILTQSSGGSGTFYYAVVARRTPAGFIGTNGVLLGDRIAPQTTENRNSTLIVNYADRRPGEPMTTRPSVGVSKYFRVVGSRLVEIAP